MKVRDRVRPEEKPETWPALQATIKHRVFEEQRKKRDISRANN